MTTALLTLMVAILAMAPGIVLARGRALDLGSLGAYGAASLAVAMAATALAGAAWRLLGGDSLPAASLVPVGILLTGIALWITRGRHWVRPAIEWQGLAATALLLLYSVVLYHLAVTEMPGGALRVHAWYNADWFKHLGHVFGLADYGVPARDIFGGGRPLHYYWLSYILPGAGTALGGDGWSALYVTNLVCGALLVMTFFGVVRLIAAPGLAALAVLTAFVVCAPLAAWPALLAEGGLQTLLYGPDAPPGPALLGFMLYIPQHALAFALLLGWAAVALTEKGTTRAGMWLLLGGLASVMTISTLFGAALLAVYGCNELYRRRLSAVPELAVMAVLAAVLVVVLGVVQLGNPNSALESPLLTDPPSQLSLLERIVYSVTVMVRNLGVPFLAYCYLAFRWKPASPTERNAFVLAAMLVVVMILVGIGVELVMSERVAHETRIRVLNMPVVSIALAGAWLFGRAFQAGPRQRAVALFGLAALLLLAAPTMILRAAWHGNAEDRFTTIIPAQDRAVLGQMRRASAPRDIVWQYPERAFLADMAGRDSWSVVIAGRTNLGTERATDYPASYPAIRQAEAYFSGAGTTIPPAAGWVYASRALHPGSYDAVVSALAGDPAWRRRFCYSDACVFERVPGPTATR